MALFPGWAAPDFAAETTAGPIRFRAWLDGAWGIVITHPDDYSPQTLRSGMAWARSCTRPVKLLGLSSAGRHLGAGTANQAAARPAEGPEFPTIRGDAGGIAALWRGVPPDVGPAAAPLDEHVVFIVDPTGMIRTTLSYPPSGDRNFADIIQVVEAFDTGCRSVRHRHAA
ncbi:thioredoxin domain-containing protein [Gluconacetobacter tumulisoli]|uniref:Peroxiredoxin n=1 Tax=Gluconacetobacter tumulisoli TaxID=1286189 RepID=A0A7W4K571_9PROT|nr:peroxiredoxin [Gluconacetobacter tumulisoli]MBB2200608.1 peroxiredoxin [Gluconacetobacter tumulisoli]